MPGHGSAICFRPSTEPNPRVLNYFSSISYHLCIKLSTPSSHRHCGQLKSRAHTLFCSPRLVTLPAPVLTSRTLVLSRPVHYTNHTKKHHQNG